jgi:hypothetical protein
MVDANADCWFDVVQKKEKKVSTTGRTRTGNLSLRRATRYHCATAAMQVCYFAPKLRFMKAPSEKMEQSMYGQMVF